MIYYAQFAKSMSAIDLKRWLYDIADIGRFLTNISYISLVQKIYIYRKNSQFLQQGLYIAFSISNEGNAECGLLHFLRKIQISIYSALRFSFLHVGMTLRTQDLGKRFVHVEMSEYRNGPTDINFGSRIIPVKISECRNDFTDLESEKLIYTRRSKQIQEQFYGH